MFIGYCKRHIVTQCYDIKVKYCGKVMKNKKHATHRQNGT